MNDTQYREQLERFATTLATLKRSAQRRKAALHPDLGRATEALQKAATAARALRGSEDPARYDQALIVLRKAVGEWNWVDSSHGKSAWSPSAPVPKPAPVPDPIEVA